MWNISDVLNRRLVSARVAAEKMKSLRQHWTEIKMELEGCDDRPLMDASLEAVAKKLYDDIVAEYTYHISKVRTVSKDYTLNHR